MITVGMAWWYRAYAGEQTPQARGQYEFAEQEARAKRAGLWADPEPTPPWEWRKAQRAGANGGDRSMQLESLRP
jgi:endonuclease YncB( thermonuclease family)